MRTVIHFLVIFATPALGLLAGERAREDDYARAVGRLQQGNVSAASAELAGMLRSGTKAAPLHMAAAQGNLEAVQQAIAAGCPVDLRTENGQTPLHLAAAEDRVDVLRFLLRQGARTDAHDESGRTPLHIAAATNSINAVQELLDARANPNVLDLVGDPQHGYTAAGETPLHTACRLRHLQVVGMLLEHGADPRQTNGKHQTAVQLMQLLHTVPADFNAEDLRLATAADLATRVSNGRVAPGDALIACSAVGDLRRVKVLLRKSPDVNFLDARGRSPLGQACEGGHFAVADCLLRKSATVNLRHPHGDRPLHFAARGENCAVAKLLLDNGADPQMRNDARQTPSDLLAINLGKRPADSPDLRAMVVARLEADMASLLSQTQSLCERGRAAHRADVARIQRLREENDLLQWEMGLVNTMTLGPSSLIPAGCVTTNVEEQLSRFGYAVIRLDDRGLSQDIAAFDRQLQVLQQAGRPEFQQAEAIARTAIGLAVLAYGKDDRRVGEVERKATAALKTASSGE
jgi:ankyrin repeat protein